MLSIDDELIALNGRKLDSNLQQLLSLQPHAIDLTLFREKKLRTITLHPDRKSYFSKFTIEKRTDTTAAEKQNFKLWLKQEFQERHT